MVVLEVLRVGDRAGGPLLIKLLIGYFSIVNNSARSSRYRKITSALGAIVGVLKNGRYRC